MMMQIMQGYAFWGFVFIAPMKGHVVYFYMVPSARDAATSRPPAGAGMGP